jgi:hypothetical protein
MRPIVAVGVIREFAVSGGFGSAGVLVVVAVGADVVVGEVAIVGAVALVIVVFAPEPGVGLRVALSPDEPHPASATLATATRIVRCQCNPTCAW